MVGGCSGSASAACCPGPALVRLLVLPVAVLRPPVVPPVAVVVLRPPVVPPVAVVVLWPPVVPPVAAVLQPPCTARCSAGPT